MPLRREDASRWVYAKSRMVPMSFSRNTRVAGPRATILALGSELGRHTQRMQDKFERPVETQITRAMTPDA